MDDDFRRRVLEDAPPFRQAHPMRDRAATAARVIWILVLITLVYFVGHIAIERLAS